MRKELSKIEGVRGRFEGIFVRFGTKRGWKGYPETTVLLKDIRLLTEGKYITDHIWFSCGKRLEALNLKENDVVRFDARVTSYEKGYKGYREDVFDAPIETDYRLSFPTNVVKINQPQGEIGKLL
jgi:hypothetical protein